MGRLRFGILILVLAGLVTAPRAQTSSGAQTQGQAQTAPSQKPVFRTRIDAVTVDAIVTDKQGRPVTDLKQEDFEIKEDNKVQKIDAFKLITIDDALDPDPAKYPELHSMEDQEREAARDDVRLTIIFLDDYHVRKGNDQVVRLQLASFVRTLNPRDLVAIAYPLTPVTGITFSRDHENTARAILNFTGRKYDYTPRNAFEEVYTRMVPQQIETLRNQITTLALQGICTFLGGLRDGRKTLLLVSEGFSGTLPVSIQQEGLGSPGAVAGQQNSVARQREENVNSLDLLGLERDIIQEADRNNTSIYTLDPRGLATTEFDVSQPNVDSTIDRNVLNESLDSLHVLADNTGGRAFVNSNDMKKPLKQMLTDTSAYYLLGYTSSQAPRDGKFHEIKVAVKRKDIEVRFRKGYYAYTTEEAARAIAPSKAGPAPDLTEAFGSLTTPAQGHVVRTWLGLDRGPDGKTSVTLIWEALPSSVSRASESPDRVTLTAGSSSGDRYYQGRVGKDPRAATPTGRVTFDAKPGVLDLRIGAESADGAVLDSEHRQVTVPDFSAVGPLVSTPLVFRARTALDVQQLTTAASPLPVLSREFSRSERVVIRFRAYGPANTSPAITLRVLNQNGDPIDSIVVPIPAPGADGTYQVDLPLAALPTGQYVFEIGATSGADKVRALVAFIVTA